MSQRKKITLSLLSLATAATLAASLAGAFAPGCTGNRDSSTVSTALQAVTCDYSVLTAHNNNARWGLQSCETVLNPNTAAYTQRIAGRTGLGTLTSQPLLVHGRTINGVVQDGLVVVANPQALNGTPPTLYVLNPRTLATILQTPLPAANYCKSYEGVGCFGVLSTPVIDPATNIIYLVESTNNAAGLPEYDLMAHDLNTLAWLAGANIGGTCSSGEAFSAYDPMTHALQQRQRPALLLDHGHVYIAFGSNNKEDQTDHSNGWIFAYNTVQSGQATLQPAGSPYCSTRGAPANQWGRAGIWQMGAGISADGAGNVYAATGNGQIGDGSAQANSANDDGESFVQVAGSPWTGALKAKFLNPDYNSFMAANEIEGSSGPVVLPGSGSGERVLGATKQGLFTILNPSAMATPAQGPFRGAWNQYWPILGDSNASLREPDAISCTSSSGCNSGGVPVFSGGIQSCCPNGCTCPLGHTSCPGGYSPCGPLIHGSHPHIHGQPSFLPSGSGNGSGTIFWWGEKDYPRLMVWSGITGTVALPTNADNRLASDLAPNASISDGNTGMPGGLTALSANGSSSVILWAHVPTDGSMPVNNSALVAFDANNVGTQPHLFSVALPTPAQAHAYPTIANGAVYVASGTGIEAYSTLPPPTPVWANPFPSGNCARSLGSGWVIGCDPDANGNGHVFRWIPGSGWTEPDAGAIRGNSISVDLNGTPWITNSAGQIFKYQWASKTFTAFQSQTGFCATAVASGATDLETWAIHCGDSGVRRWNGTAWAQVGTVPATKIAVFSQADSVCGLHLPWLQVAGSPPTFRQGQIDASCGTYSFASTPYTGFGLTTDYLLGTDGNLYHWNGTSLESAYISTPWGTSSAIAGWSGGIYAASINTADGMRKIQGQ